MMGVFELSQGGEVRERASLYISGEYCQFVPERQNVFQHLQCSISPLLETFIEHVEVTCHIYSKVQFFQPLGIFQLLVVMVFAFQ